MALMEVNFFSKALMRPVTMNVILPADKVFFGEETEEENKPFKTLYLLHGVMGNYTDWVTGTCIKRWAEEKNLAVVMPSGANMFYMDHPNVSWYFRPFRIAPYPPIDNPAINVSSFLWDNGNILRVIFTSSFPINSL